MPELSQETQDAVRRVEKLLKLAAKNPNQNEAAAATAKAQEILAQYNLDMATVEANSGDTGKREEAKTKGGLYHYQRDMWRAVADLNFCMYWNQYRYDPNKSRVQKRKIDERWSDEANKYVPVYERTAVKGGYTFEHKLVGRTVNVASTRVMAQYLEQTIERLTRERLNGDGSQFFTKWAVSFREGIAEAVIEKIMTERRHLLAKERKAAMKAKLDAERAAAAGASTATTLTLVEVAASEYAANYDFVYGEGTWAAKLARQAEAAEAERKEEERYTQWAKENPEEARQLEEAERKRRRSYGARDYSDRKADKRDYGAYRAGAEVGAKVSIRPQADHKVGGLLK